MPNLKASHQLIASVDEIMLAELYDLFCRHYDHVSFEKFKADFSKKDYVIVLRESEGNEIRGFSTQVLYDYVVDETPIKILFSGDTIIDRECWGEQALMKTWCSLAGAIKSQYPTTKLYWLLISKGYRTYLYLPLFYRSFYPRRGNDLLAFEQKIASTFAVEKFGSSFNPVSGIISFDSPQGQLRPELADIPMHRQDDLDVRFFLERNPHYRAGDELVCVAELTVGNMKGAARRYFTEGMIEVKAVA